MEFEERPFTTKQRREIEGYVVPYIQLLRMLLFAGTVAVVGATLRSIQSLMYDGLPVWLVPTALVAVFLYDRAGRWTGGSTFRKLIRLDLKNGNARVIVVDPIDVVEVEEIEDEGPSFIIETESGETILLTGQYLDGYKTRQFPWTRFEIIEAPASRLFLGLRKTGEPLSVTSKRPPFSYDVAKRLGCFEHNYVVLDKEAKDLALES